MKYILYLIYIQDRVFIIVICIVCVFKNSKLKFIQQFPQNMNSVSLVS